MLVEVGLEGLQAGTRRELRGIRLHQGVGHVHQEPVFRSEFAHHLSDPARGGVHIAAPGDAGHVVPLIGVHHDDDLAWATTRSVRIHHENAVILLDGPHPAELVEQPGPVGADVHREAARVQQPIEAESSNSSRSVRLFTSADY